MYSSPSKAGLKQEDSGLKCAVIVTGRLHLLSLPETLVRKHSPKVATMKSTEREARLLRGKIDTCELN
jgi:hypothetical protein